MNKNATSLVIAVFLASFLIPGCETVAGTSRGAARGAGEDMENAGKAAKTVVEAPGKIDKKMREELW
ncbi:MAG: hypothetical protein WBE75_03640 [Candidatus Omnitrophota bacterium]|jgi:predicted small secreted protein